MTGLTKTQRVIVSLPRNRKARGVILEVYEKSYLVLLDGEAEPRRFSAAKVKPESGRKPTAKLEIRCDISATMGRPSVLTIPIDVSPVPRPLRQVPKPDFPEECPAWLRFAKKFPCCNCGVSSPIEAHHEGKKDAAFQKVRDTLAVPLCAWCHFVYTQKNALPVPSLSAPGSKGKIPLRTREESLEILRAEQERLLQLVLAQLEPRDRIEILSRGIAQLRRPGALAPLLGRISEAA